MSSADTAICARAGAASAMAAARAVMAMTSLGRLMVASLMCGECRDTGTPTAALSRVRDRAEVLENLARGFSVALSPGILGQGLIGSAVTAA